MSSYATRLERLEGAIQPAGLPKYVQGVMHYDDYGHPAKLELQRQAFAPMPGESEDDLCTRAMKAVGSADNLILIQLVKPGPNGGLAPGFERFAKHA